MSDQQSTKPARGTRDFLPADIRRREYVLGIIRGVYERYGFEPLETPAFENIETLLGKYGEEGNQLIFKILKRGEEAKTGEADLALRYDLTVPLARVVAQYQNELPRFFKRYQIQPVWRADRPARGRFREFYQCDIDSVGSTSPIVEAEILAAVSDILTALGFDDFVIRLNDRRILTGLLDSSGIPKSQHVDALTALDKLDKIGQEGVLREMTSRGIDESASLRGLRLALNPSLDAHRAIPRTFKATQAKESLQGLYDAVAHLSGLSAIEDIIALCGGTSAADRIRFDPSLARGLSYYTGAIMEIAVEGIGSLGGGGRYDNLVGMFLGRDVPACGFSLGLERILVVMTERNMFPATLTQGAVDVVVTCMDDDSLGEAMKLAATLRGNGLRVDVFPETGRKFDKPLKYATSRGAKAMAIFGENERARGEVSIRNLATREQQTVPLPEAVSRFRALVAES